MQYNGNSYAPGTAIDVVKGLNTFTYTGMERGSHTISFTVNSSANQSHDASVSIAFNEADFEFTGNISKDEFSVGESATITMNVNELEGSSTYKGRFSMSGTATVTDHNGNVISVGDIIDIPKGSFTWKVEGTTDNDVSMTIYAKNDTGKEKPINISFTVKPKEFNFSATPAKSSALTNESVDVLLKVEELGIGGDTYTAYYSNNNNGYITYNSQKYYPGQNFAISSGNTTVRYTQTSGESGTHNLNFTVLSSSGVSKSDNATINFEKFEEPFTLNVSQSSRRKTKGNPFTLNITTNAPSGHNSDVNYNLTFTFNGVTGGTIRYKGKTYSTGQKIPIDYGAISMEFTPSTEEDFTINFNASNSTGQTASASTSVDMYKEPSVSKSSIRTWYFRDDRGSCFNGCDYDHHYLIKFDYQTDDSASLKEFKVAFDNNNTYTVVISTAEKRDNFTYFRFDNNQEPGKILDLDNKTFTLILKDSNGDSTEYSNLKFTNDKNDSQ